MKDFNIHISKQIIDDKLIGLGFFKRNSSLTNFRQFSIKTHYSNERNMMFDVSASLNTKLIEEIISQVYSFVNLQLMNSLDTILDLRGLTHINKLKKITNDLASFKYHNMITNSRLAVELQDSPMFHSSGVINTMSNQIYNVGLFNQNNLYVDSFIPHKDYRIAFFDDIDINVGEVKFYEVKSAPEHYNHFLILDAKIDFKLNNKHLVGVMDEFNTDALSTYRETKIDEILNGDI